MAQFSRIGLPGMKHFKRMTEHRRAVHLLSHADAARHLVDYHFGRLSPELNAAMEAHVRVCDRCQREGLRHAATEKREAVRRLSKVRPKKRPPRLRTRLRLVILLLLAIFALEVAVLARGGLLTILSDVLGGGAALVSSPPTASATSMFASASFQRQAARTHHHNVSSEDRLVVLVAVQPGEPIHASISVAL